MDPKILTPLIVFISAISTLTTTVNHPALTDKVSSRCISMKGHLNLVDVAALTGAMAHFGIFSPQTVTDAQGRKMETVSLNYDSQTLHIEAQDDLLGLTDQSTEKD